MATYLSQPYQGSEFVSGVPIDLITKVGMMKQMKYEQTVDTIQNSLDEIDNSDILKDSERQYVSERLKQTVDKLNQFSGQNISDSPIKNQLKGYVSSVARDPRLYAAIADTRSIRNNIAQLNEIKEKRPQEYAAQNEALFMEGINSYLNGGAGTRYSGQTYTPYYNYDENYRKIAKQVQDNPDIQQEINYAVGSDGKPYPRSTQEVKRVTQQKIQQALMNSGDQRAMRQMQIDYQFSMPNKTVEGAVQELRAAREDQMATLKEAKDAIAKGIADPEILKIAQQVINNIEGDGKDNAGALKQLDAKINEVRATGDPSKYYTLDKYVKDYTAGLARSFAFEQKGKIDYDDMFLEDYKFNHQLQLEQVKSAYKLQEEKMKGLGGVDMSTFTDNFTNSFLNIEDNPNRESNIDNEGMSSLFDGTKNSDGSFNITLGQGLTYLDIGKIAEANGIQGQTSNKLNGLSTFNSELAKWVKAQPKQRTPNSVGGAIAQNASLEDLNVFGNFGKQQGGQRIVDNIDQFLASDKGKQIAQQIKDQTGLDVTNATDRKNLETFAASEDAQTLMEFGDALSTIKGQVAVRPMNGMNLFAGNDGQYYGKMQGLFTEGQLRTALGDSGFNKLLDKGVIEATLNQTEAKGKRDAETLYSLPITRKVEKDVQSAYNSYMVGLNAGDNFYVKSLPAYQQRFKDTFTSMVGTRGLDPNTLKTKGQETLDILAKLPDAQGVQGTNNLNYLKNEYLKATAVLASGASSSLSKLQAKKFLSDLIENSQRISNLQGQPQASNNQTPRQPGQTIGEYANNPGNLKYTPNDPIVKMFGGTDSGIKGNDGGTFTTFPDQATGFKAFQARLFGPSDGLYSSNYYQPTKTVNEALKSYSNYRTQNGKIQGYDGSIYPEVQNKRLKDLTQQEREELSSRMLKIENVTVYNQLVDAGVIKKV